MKNYLSHAAEWRRVKDSVQAHYERLKPTITACIEAHKSLSGQEIPAVTLSVADRLAFYPFWGGWAFKFSVGWWTTPTDGRGHWEVTLRQAKEVEAALAALEGEEEVRLLFRRWTEEVERKEDSHDC